MCPNQKTSVLYVDPEPKNGTGIRRIVRGKQNIFTATNVSMAHRMLSAGQSIIGIIIVEYRMQGKYSGLDLLAQITNSHPHILRVLTSTSVSPCIQEAMKTGVIQSHLFKPWDIGELASLLVVRGV